jgi:hypothetical protein
MNEIARTTAGMTVESLRKEAVSAATRAIHRHFGADANVEAHFESADLKLFQFGKVVQTPSARGELSIDAVRALPEVVEVDLGDELAFLMCYTHNKEEMKQAANFDGLGLSYPGHVPDFWPVLIEELNQWLARYLPLPDYEEGTLGALLQGKHGWGRGLIVQNGGYQLELVRPVFDFARIDPDGGWVSYGFETALRRDGVEVFRGKDPYEEKKLDGRFVRALVTGQSANDFAFWASLPASSTDLRPLLQQVLDGFVDGGDLGGDVRAMMQAAIRPPIAGGIWQWMQEHLSDSLRGHVHEREHAGRMIRFEIDEVSPPNAVLRGFGEVGVGYALSIPAEDRRASGTVMVGGLSSEALRVPGPTSADDEEALLSIVKRFKAWFDETIDQHLAPDAHPLLNELKRAIDQPPHNAVPFPGAFPLPRLLVQRMQWGPPGPPPVPYPGERAREAAKRLQRVDPATVQINSPHAHAAYVIEGWTLVLEDDRRERPFGAYCGIRLISPEGGEAIDVLMVDAWNPPQRHVVDGDAFAFRRFTQWLRETILAAGQDVALTYGLESFTLSASDWLLFGLPETRDRHLVDWRSQWDIVNAGSGIASLAKCYRFSGAHLERLRARDTPQWRRFLREVVDPRFPEEAWCAAAPGGSVTGGLPGNSA